MFYSLHANECRAESRGTRWLQREGAGLMGMVIEGYPSTQIEERLARIEELLVRLVEATEAIAKSQNAEYGFRR